MDMKRKNAYNYFLKSKTDPDLKQKIDDNRRNWYDKHKDKVQEARRERLKNDTEFREKINAQKRENYRKRTADVPKKKRGRKPNSKQIQSVDTTNDSNDSSSDTKSSNGECKEPQTKPDLSEQFKNLSMEEISSIIQLLQKQLNQPM